MPDVGIGSEGGQDARSASGELENSLAKSRRRSQLLFSLHFPSHPSVRHPGPVRNMAPISFALVGSLVVSTLLLAVNAEVWTIEAQWRGYGQCAGGLNLADVFPYDGPVRIGAQSYKFECNSTSVSYFVCENLDGTNCTVKGCTFAVGWCGRPPQKS